MEKKYPVLQCNEQLWKEIKSVLIDWGISGFININYNAWNAYPYLVSNFGNSQQDSLIIGNCYNPNIDDDNSLRYLVNTKEEFLIDVAKLLDKKYNMERINIAEKLKNCPKGFKLYSKIHGNVKLSKVEDNYIKVTTKNKNNADCTIFYDYYGIYDTNFYNAECMLFPSKEQQDWNKFTYLEKGHRVMVSDNSKCWYLREYINNNLACGVIDDTYTGYDNWKYIVPVENFDFQAKDLSINIKKSIV